MAHQTDMDPPTGRPKPSGTFQCSGCGLSAPYEAYGRTLKPREGLERADGESNSRIVFLEDGFLVSDPNAARRRPLFLGALCCQCQAPVCPGESCSLFYAKRFCAACARTHRSAFPPQVIKMAPKVFAPG